MHIYINLTYYICDIYVCMCVFVCVCFCVYKIEMMKLYRNKDSQ